MRDQTGDKSEQAALQAGRRPLRQGSGALRRVLVIACAALVCLLTAQPLCAKPRLAARVLMRLDQPADAGKPLRILATAVAKTAFEDGRIVC